MNHGIMFHHFHGGAHPVGQGSLSGSDFHEMLRWLRKNYRVLDAADFLTAAVSGKLGKRDTCLTFDDSLLCQYEIAAPILADEGLTAFYFVYSSVFTDKPDMLEIFRYFRSTEFPDFNSFFEEFYEEASVQYPTKLTEALEGFQPESYLSQFPFYSDQDRIFRFIRDRVLAPSEYLDVMQGLMREHNFDIGKTLPLLYMQPSHLDSLQRWGNIVGLHSHSHPTTMDALDEHRQREEYETNHAVISRLLRQKPLTMSHPCGRYTSETLQILRELGILLGFRSSLSVCKSPSLLEFPREDHTNILARMRS